MTFAGESDDQRYLERDGVAVRLLGYDGADVPPQKGDRRFCYYIDVCDVDALYTELKPALDTMPKGDVYGPINQPYGQRELLVLAPDNNLVVFGQGLSALEESNVTCEAFGS